MTSEFAIAVHALVVLFHRGQVMSSETLASNVCTNPTRVRKTLSQLKKAGLVETKEGVDGGYLLIRDGETITLEQIADILEITFVSAAWKSGDPSRDCAICSGMGALLDEVYADLDRVCRNRLSQITIASLDRRLFQERNGSLRPEEMTEQK